LLGRAGAARLLSWAVEVAEAVPVFRLRFARDFDRLDDVVEQFQRWHASVATVAP
jgi:hypothetical protein